MKKNNSGSNTHIAQIFVWWVTGFSLICAGLWAVFLYFNDGSGSQMPLDNNKVEKHEQIEVVENNTFSTNIDNPKWLSTNDIRGYGVGESVSHYYTFIADPGIVKVTADAKNEHTGIANALGVVLMDMDAKNLLKLHMGNTTIDKRIVKRVRIHKRQQIIIRILLDEVTIDYMVRIEADNKIGKEK